MNFTFFTLGGRQLWEDIFFSNKWRIQRNCLTKRYRLLDNWDIRRASGSYDTCSRAFEHCMKVFQIQKQEKRAVIMLHGLTGNKNQFREMSKMCESLGMSAIAVNYPSTRKGMKSHIHQLSFFMDNLKNISEVCFITDGVGGLIVRELLNCDSVRKNKIKISKVIQIDPTNRGYRLWEKMAGSKICTFFLGNLLAYGRRNLTKKVPTFPKGVQFGIINTQNYLWSAVKFLFPKKVKKILFNISDSFLPNANDIKDIKTWHMNSLNDRETIRCCRNFIRNGKFQ